MNPKIRMTACALAACALVSELHAQETVMEPVVVKAKRENRVSKGATGLPMEIKETPQTISTIEKQQIKDFGATSSNTPGTRANAPTAGNGWRTAQTPPKIRKLMTARTPAPMPP